MSTKKEYYCLDRDTKQVWKTEAKPRLMRNTFWATDTPQSWKRVTSAELQMIGEINQGECFLVEYNSDALTLIKKANIHKTPTIQESEL